MTEKESQKETEEIISNESVEEKPTEKKKFSAKRLISFGTVSAITGLIAMGGFLLLMHLYDVLLASSALSRDWALVIAEYVSVIVSCLFSFSLNKRFTFPDRKARRAGIWLYILYYFVVTPLGAWLMVWLVNLSLPDYVAKLIKMTINLVTDFLYCRYFLFRYLKKKYDPSINEAFLKSELTGK